MTKTKKRGSGNGIRIFVLILVVLVIVSLFLFGGALRGMTIQRLAYYLTSGISGTPDTANISFVANDHNRFHLLQKGLAILSNEKLSVYSMSGEEKYSVSLTYRTPAISGSEKYMIAYDRGGTEFVVTNGTSSLLQSEAEAKIINANINRNGAFSLITDGPDCKTLLSIYNPSFDIVYKLHSTEQYVMDAAISNNNKSMAILALSASGDGFVGTVSFYHLDEDQPYFSHTLTDTVPLSVQYDKDGRIRVLCENCFLLFDKDGTLVSEIPFEQTELLSHTFGSSRMVGLLTNNYSTGGNSALTLLSRNDSEPLSISFREETLSISAAGNFIAVRCPNKIVVYDRNLQVDRTYTVPSGVKSCIMREDGTVLIIGADFATLLIS